MNIERARILLVEDDPDDVWIMQGLLGNRWDGPFELVHAEMLSVALAHLARRQFDVVLLDLALPDSQGIETFAKLHARAGGVPIVVLTGETNERMGVTAVQAGAEDYLVKGQLDDHLLVRSVRYAVERHRRRRAENELRRTSEEFRLAGQIQQGLFPAGPPALPGFDLWGDLHPARTTAGDYYDFFSLPDGRTAVAIGDVSGHGMGPALLMAETRASLRALADSSSDVGEILTRANRILTGGADEGHFVTLMLAALDPVQRTLVYASAGQRGYLLEPAGTWQTLESTSLPLGVDASVEVPVAPPIDLVSGHILALFTDGLVEIDSPGQGRFGAARALEQIWLERDRPAREIVTHLQRSALAFSGHHAPPDDVTIVLAKVL